ncbi:MAG: hypothetical protein SGILL_000293 [Bacillariaceae sp.]
MNARISRLFPLMRNASKSTATSKNPAGLEKDVNAILLCVGMAGVPAVFGTTPLISSISQRMGDCIDVLCTTTSNDGTSSANDLAAMRSLIASILLTEDGDRVTNAMAKSSKQVMLAKEDDGGGGGLLGSTKRRSVDQTALGLVEDENPLIINSADMARATVERLAVLSVCESDTQFRKFEGRNKEPEKGAGTKKRLRKTTKDADLDGFDFRGKARSTPYNVSSSASSVSGSTTTTLPSSDASFSMRSTASSGSNLALKGPKKDTSSRASNRAPLLRPSKDDPGRNRRSTMGHTSSVASRGRNPAGGRRPSGFGDTNGAAAGGFAFGNSTHSKQSLRSQSDAASMASSRSQTQSQSSRQQDFDPFQDIAAHTPAPGFGSELVDGNGNDFGSNDSAKVLVNIALNEDLTCFYKLSKMSSCTVEGVVQVQVKSNADQGVPFFLLIRDPSKHIQSIQENKKFADSMADSLASEPASTRPDYMFTVSVPKADNYFPVMRYKCGNELRPVPIVSLSCR